MTYGEIYLMIGGDGKYDRAAYIGHVLMYYSITG